jgi:hypothetical protein
MHTEFYSENLNRRQCLADLGTSEKIILKQNGRKWSVNVWTGPNWFGSDSCCYDNIFSDYIKEWGISSPLQQQSVCQEWTCIMELLSQSKGRMNLLKPLKLCAVYTVSQMMFWQTKCLGYLFYHQ